MASPPYQLSDDCKGTRKWHILDEWKWCLGAPLKCGSLSIREIAGKRPESTPKAVAKLEDYYKVAIIRHPVPRFYSFWRNKVRDGRTHNKNFLSMRGLTPDETWEVIRSNLYNDAHFVPQYEIRHELADEIVRLEDLSGWWRANRPPGSPQMPVVNQTDSEEQLISPRLAKLIEHAYHIDMEIWANATGSRDTPSASAY